MEGYDYVSSSPSSIKSAGGSFVVRYVGTTSKCITTSELKALHAVGLAVGMVYETTGTTFRNGYSAGQKDGSAAGKAAKKLGAPAGEVIYFAIDTDTHDYKTVNLYLAGCQSACGPYVAKLYGSFSVVENAPGNNHWQTYAWSSGRVSKKAGLIQYLNGSTRDHDKTLPGGPTNVGGWLSYGNSPAPSPSPAPVPTPSPAPIPTPAPVPSTGHAIFDAVTPARKQIKHPSQNWTGECLIFVRTQFGIGSKYPTAAAAYNATAQSDRHMDSNPPANVPLWWTGGSTGAGHVAVSSGNGKCISSDIHGSGTVAEVPITEIHAKWGENYKGWTETLEDVRIWAKGAPVPVPTPTPISGSVSYAVILHAAQTAGIDESVKLVQQALVNAGFMSATWSDSNGNSGSLVDGHFGTHTRHAYARYQAAQGYSGQQADGIPGMTSLRMLGAKYGFGVAA